MNFNSPYPTSCRSLGCSGTRIGMSDWCDECYKNMALKAAVLPIDLAVPDKALSLVEKYPKYFKDVTELNEVDVYQVHNLFCINDNSGAIHHASKKLLLSGDRNGGKSKYQDVKEARDSLNRWLEINEKLEA